MTDPLVRYICTCGYHLVTNPDAEQKWSLSNKGFAQIFLPCIKCLKSQAEDMIEAIEVEKDFCSDEPGTREVFKRAIEIIKENVGVE